MSVIASPHSSPALAAGLQLRALSKTFPGTRALDDVSFDVARGTIHALLGGNGSGKSTLIKVLAGVEGGDPGGTVQFGDHREQSDRVTPAWSADAGLRFVHQDLGLFESLSVVENMYAGRRAPRRAGRIDWRGMRREAQSALDGLGVDVGADAALSSIRPSDRTLVAIARALADSHDTAATLLVLDEPTARLAPAEAATLLRALHRYAQRGHTILYVSHRLEEVFELARAVTVLRDGRHVRTCPVSSLDGTSVVELMVGHALAREPERRPRQIGEPILSVRRLTGGALNGVDMTIRRGEIVGVAGLVGSGRTQLLETIFGAREPVEGDLALEGRALAPDQIGSAISRGISLVPEDRGAEGVFASLGIPENLSASDSRRYSRHLVFRHAQERAEAKQAIETMGIQSPSVTASLHTLSGGNQQKVVLGRWLRMTPKLLLLDEPTQGVDVAARADIHHQIDVAAERGCAVLVVSSDLDELLRLADRVLVLAGGRIVAEASGTALDHQWLAERMYGSTNEGSQTR